MSRRVAICARNTLDGQRPFCAGPHYTTEKIFTIGTLDLRFPLLKTFQLSIRWSFCSNSTWLSHTDKTIYFFLPSFFLFYSFFLSNTRTRTHTHIHIDSREDAKKKKTFSLKYHKIIFFLFYHHWFSSCKMKSETKKNRNKNNVRENLN